ncbi:hypothetical protein FB45DRAFT_918385 [Roridomyces roridus]|uniref:RRM domain-containing protein n=1 Tax=Roridomyces roridus TaxID=1738132 RepID=A0AAD7BRB5_9AGAR|nr:hypothetical protein FB45DRAFT_918385 [Roridomyces roridus]
MSKVVFVGNVPYNMGEDALIDVFKSVGQVVGFRLVFDRETGKPKGYGFCEFADHETALSAVRNLHNTDVGGRSLRIDLADSDPFLEGKTTVKGELMPFDDMPPGAAEPRSQWRGNGPEGSDILASVPPGRPLAPGEDPQEAITRIMAQVMSESELIEVLAQMKAFVITHPKQAHQLLLRHPQVAYAIFMGLITTNIIPADLLHRMVEAQTGGSRPPPPQHFGPPTPQSLFGGPPPPGQMHQAYPPPPSRLQQQPPPMMPQGPYGHPGMQGMPPQGMPPGMPPYYRGPPPSGMPQMPPMSMPMHHGQPPPMHQQPPPQSMQQQQPPLLSMLKGGPGGGGGGGGDLGAGENKEALYALVMNLTPAQLSELPASERQTIENLRTVLRTNPDALRG